MHQVGPVPVLVGTDEQARQESADYPVQVEVLETWLALEPGILGPVVTSLGGSK